MKTTITMTITNDKQIEQDILADMLDMLADQNGDEGMQHHAFRVRNDRTVTTTISAETACLLALFAADFPMRSPEGEKARKAFCTTLQDSRERRLAK